MAQVRLEVRFLLRQSVCPQLEEAGRLSTDRIHQAHALTVGYRRLGAGQVFVTVHRNGLRQVVQLGTERRRKGIQVVLGGAGQGRLT